MGVVEWIRYPYDLIKRGINWIGNKANKWIAHKGMDMFGTSIAPVVGETGAKWIAEKGKGAYDWYMDEPAPVLTNEDYKMPGGFGDSRWDDPPIS